jgi:hypothetical protein
VWVSHCKDLLVPTLTELMRGSRLMSREESAHLTKEVVNRLLAMQNEVEVRFDCFVVCLIVLTIFF